jgi:hypothetical protein
LHLARRVVPFHLGSSHITNRSIAVSWKGLSPAGRQRVELAVAVSQEKLLTVHVDHALDLIDLVNNDVTFTDTLEIYSRLLRLDEEDARNISTRALAILGEKAQVREWPEHEALTEIDVEEEGRRSFFGGFRQRLRGRVNEELRRRIELVAARAEVALTQAHVTNALHFVDFLDSEMNERQAIELYLDALDVRDAIAEVVYYLALARIADDVLPPHGSGLASARRRSGLNAPEDANQPR